MNIELGINWGFDFIIQITYGKGDHRFFNVENKINAELFAGNIIAIFKLKKK